MAHSDIDYSTRGAFVDVTAAAGGVLLILGGGFGILQGAAAIADPEFFVAGSDYTFRLDVAAWGWVHLILGVLTIAVGVAVLKRVTWGLLVGIGLAALAAVENFLFLPLYPWWALTIIVVNVLVIWALSAQLRAAR